MKQRLPVLNWFARDPALVGDLRATIAAAQAITYDSDYIPRVTIRLGRTWADRLTPGQVVAISVSDDPERPQVIGRARVAALSIVPLHHIEDANLERNIGAKTQAQALVDMRSVYGPDMPADALVTLVELAFVNERNFAGLA